MVVGALLVWVMPAPAQRYAEALGSHFWPSLGWGFLILIGVPLVSLLFVMTLVGIPLAIILCVLYLLGLFLSKLGVGYCLGRMIFKKNPGLHPVLVFLVGFGLLAATGFIPIAGSIISWGAIIVGLGGLITMMNRKKAVPVPAAVAVPQAEQAAAPAAPAPTAAVTAAGASGHVVATAPARGKRTRPARKTAKTVKRVKTVKKSSRKAAPKKRSGRK